MMTIITTVVITVVCVFVVAAALCCFIQVNVTSTFGPLLHKYILYNCHLGVVN